MWERSASSSVTGADVFGASEKRYDGEGGAAAKKKPARPGDGFTYYLLSLSYAPDFCAEAAGDKDPRECGAGRDIGFVVHGLWPQAETGRGPEACGPAKAVSQAIINATLSYIPTQSLIQHEWKTHGTCSGLAPVDYFALVRKARNSITIPADLKQPMEQLQLTPADIEAKFAAANPLMPNTAFRASCYEDGSLQEARVCFNKDLSGRECSRSAGQCSADIIVVRAVK